VAYICNPSYSGGRDHEDHGSKPNSPQDLISKIPITKRAGGMAQGVVPEFKPQSPSTAKKKKKKKVYFYIMVQNWFLIVYSLLF
jgi:hypothetical protein